MIFFYFTEKINRDTFLNITVSLGIFLPAFFILEFFGWVQPALYPCGGNDVRIHAFQNRK